MAKREKRRLMDFTKREMAELSGCANLVSFDNRMKKISDHYGFDSNLFKMDRDVAGGESFFPAECGELVALLARCYDKNPVSKRGNVQERITVSDIREFYEYIYKEVDKMSPTIRELVYMMPSYHAARWIGVYAEYIVKIMTNFMVLFTGNFNDDIIHMMNIVCTDLDYAGYALFEDKFLRHDVAEESGFLYGEEHDEVWINRSAFDKKRFIDVNIRRGNVGLDRDIARLIERFFVDLEEVKKDMKFEDSMMTREEYYEQNIRQKHIDGIGILNKQLSDEAEEIIKNGLMTIEERIESGQSVSEYLSELGAIARYKYDKYHGSLEKRDLRMLFDLEDYKKKMGDNEIEREKKCNEKYADDCKKNRELHPEIRKYADRFVGSILWEFLDKK